MMERVLVLTPLLVAAGLGARLVTTPVAVAEVLAEMATGATDEVGSGSETKLVTVVRNPGAAVEEMLTESVSGPVDEVVLGSDTKLVMVVMKPVALVDAFCETTTGLVEIGAGASEIVKLVWFEMLVLCGTVIAVMVTIGAMLCPKVSCQFTNAASEERKQNLHQ